MNRRDKKDGPLGSMEETTSLGVLAALHLHRSFEIPAPGIDVDPAAMSWPARGEAGEEGLNNNREYADMRGIRWHRAHRILQLDRAIVQSFGRARAGSARDLARFEDYEYLWHRQLMGLDIGVASTVAVISAAGAVPIYSCNAGALGGPHAEPVPVVSFYWRKWALRILEESARAAGMSLWNGKYGEVVLAADQLPRFISFAETLEGRRRELGRARRDAAAAVPRRRKPYPTAVQLDLLSMLPPDEPVPGAA